MRYVLVLRVLHSCYSTYKPYPIQLTLTNFTFFSFFLNFNVQLRTCFRMQRYKLHSIYSKLVHTYMNAVLNMVLCFYRKLFYSVWTNNNLKLKRDPTVPNMSTHNNSSTSYSTYGWNAFSRRLQMLLCC